MSTRNIAQYGLLTSAMLVLGLVERQFVIVPGVPGIRLGLSNIVLLYALVLISASGAWLLMVLKVLLGGFLYAGVTGLFYSLAGGVLSMLAMQLVLRVRGVGMVGISVAGAAAHMLGQLAVSRWLLGSWSALAQAPILLVAAVVTGVLTGVVAQVVCRAMAKTDPKMQERLRELGLAGEERP
ncbi:Gx transporter family protein [Eubacteriales bacterium OttesenSCG-928-A19]|nr:Gx transporter family protein [Eubacteriales bacterium OttesenSCG-928-A19]